MIALSDWVLWAAHHAQSPIQSPIQSLIHPLSPPLTPSPTPPTNPPPSSSGSGATANAAIVVALIALAGSVASTVVALVVGIRSSRAANRAATAAENSATAAGKAAAVAEESRIDLESRSRREEVMRNVRWASGLAISDDRATRELGIEQLKVLRESPLSDDDVRRLIYATLTVVMEPIERRAGADLGVTVQITAEGVVDEGSSGLPSEGNQSEEGDDHGS